MVRSPSKTADGKGAPPPAPLPSTRPYQPTPYLGEIVLVSAGSLSAMDDGRATFPRLTSREHGSDRFGYERFGARPAGYQNARRAPETARL